MQGVRKLYNVKKYKEASGMPWLEILGMGNL
jgi:hypothetical protein